MQLKITANEAQIIEMSLKNEDEALAMLKPFLLQIGWSLISQEEVTLEVAESDLWFLRNRVMPQSKVGNSYGLDVLKKIYRLLLEEHNHELIGTLALPKELNEKEYLERRRKQYGTDRDRSNSKDYAENSANP